MTELSRDAQVTAIALFHNGKGEFACHNHFRINERTKAALSEMVELGVVTVERQGGSVFYSAVPEKLGCPMSDFPAIKESECFNIIEKKPE